jgi:oxygen-dependent protoporphyrinogen oxidase
MRAARGNPPAPIFTSLNQGMEQMVAPLVNAIEGDLRTEWPVAALLRKQDGWHLLPGRKGQLPVRADVVVIALPANHAAGLVRQRDEDLAARLNEIRYVTSAVVALGYRRADLATARKGIGFGFLVARGENRKIIGCTCLSAKFGGRADAEHALFGVFIGGDGQEERAEQAEEDLVSRARAELSEVLGIRAEPVVTRVYPWPKGNPQYDVGHVTRVDNIMEQAGKQPDLHLTGSAYRGISVSDCARHAEAVADRVVGNL